MEDSDGRSDDEEDSYNYHEASCNTVPSSPTPLPVAANDTSHTSNTPTKSPAEPCFKPVERVQNTLHAFFNIRGQPPSIANPALSPLKRKKSLGEKAKLPVAKKQKPVGTSKSAQYKARARAAADSGAIDCKKFSQFKLKILELDPRAEFLIGNDVRRVRHSKCGEVNRQKAPYNTTYFVNHVEKCQGPSKKNSHIVGVDRSVLSNFLQHQSSSTSPGPNPSTHSNSETRLCPGLTPEHDTRISDYLLRSQAAGGGAQPRKDIVQELFGEGAKWSNLDEREQKRVEHREVREFRWLNFSQQDFVISTTCLKTVSAEDPANSCSECLNLLKLKVFKNALRRKLPNDENLRYTPLAYRAKMTGEQYTKMIGAHEIIRNVTNVCRFHPLLRLPDLHDATSRMGLTHLHASYLGYSGGNTKGPNLRQ